MNKPLVIYHKNCQDGFTAAWACWLLNPDWEYYPATHGDPAPDVTGRDVYMLDFSYKHDVILNMLTVAKSVTIIDHHETAMDELRIVAAKSSEYKAPLVFCLDMNHSGAYLAWKYFHPDVDVPRLVTIVEDRDLWLFKHSRTEAWTTYIYSLPYSFADWSDLYWSFECDFQARRRMQEQGEAILNNRKKEIQELADSSTSYATIGSVRVKCLNVPYFFASHAGDIMDKNEPFSATYYYNGKQFVYSLRSDENGMDVAQIAALYGGGGHKHAAGFQSNTMLV